MIYWIFQAYRTHITYIPFIDFPELAEYVWGTQMGAKWPGEKSLNIATNYKNPLSIYPNPAFDILYIKFFAYAHEPDDDAGKFFPK